MTGAAHAERESTMFGQESRWRMPRRRLRGRWQGLVCIAAVCVVARSDVAAASAAAGLGPTTCFWSDVAGAPQNNILLPDRAGTYWYSRFYLPPGGKVILRGEAPHARSFFLWAYRSITPYDGLHDSQIAPDPGSSNPFGPGADRTASRRSFTLTIEAKAPPSPWARAANTIYVGSRGLAWLPQEVQLSYRVEVPDEGRDRTGDAGVPDAVYVSPWGARRSGQSACDALGNNGAKVPKVTLLLAPDYLAHLALSPAPTHPATDPLRWYAFFNLGRLAEPFYEGTPAAGLNALLPTNKSTLAARPDADVSIAYSYVDRSLGPDPGGHNVLVLRGKLPTTPSTFHGDSRMRAGTQLRYWSLCQNDSFVLGRVGACLYDEQIPLDQSGAYTIVASLPGDRPANATRACGVAWLDYGTLGDGLMKQRAGLLLLRNQLPDASFARSIEAVRTPDTEARAMGDYLPSGGYQSKAQFEASGCD
jgi:hypothetical protein